MREIVKAPIYQQLNQVLRETIRSGAYAVGDRFMTEREICERYGVSRATANKALSNLVSEGALEFRKGVGTFVRGGSLDYNLRSLVSFTEEVLAAGKQPGTQLLRMERLPAAQLEPETRQALQVDGEEPVFYMERLRTADDVPVIFERRHIVARYCPGLTSERLTGSLYRLLVDEYGLQVAGADQRIRAVTLRGPEARLLGAAAGSAGFLILSRGLLESGAPLWWERTIYRGDAYEFYNRLGPIQPAERAYGKFLDIQP